jgi:hypothetical protein
MYVSKFVDNVHVQIYAFFFKLRTHSHTRTTLHIPVLAHNGIFRSTQMNRGIKHVLSTKIRAKLCIHGYHADSLSLLTVSAIFYSSATINYRSSTGSIIAGISVKTKVTVLLRGFFL